MHESSKQSPSVPSEIQRMNLAEKKELEKLGYFVDGNGNLIVGNDSKESSKVSLLAKYLRIPVSRENGLVRLDLKDFLLTRRKRTFLLITLLMFGLSLAIAPESDRDDIETASMDLSPSVITVEYSSDNKTYEPSLGSGLTEVRSGNSLLLQVEKNPSILRKYQEQLAKLGINDESQLGESFTLTTPTGVELYTVITTSNGQVFIVYSVETGETSASGAGVRAEVVKKTEKKGKSLSVDGQVIIHLDEKGNLQVSVFPGASRTMPAPSMVGTILGFDKNS